MTAKPIWSRVLEEILHKLASDQQRPPASGQTSQVDLYRRSKIKAVQDLTNRPLIVYATGCTPPKQLHPAMIMIEPGDLVGFQAVTENLKGKRLDVLIHSPGGYPDAAESIVKMLRRRFDDIRFIVPAFAKSAATMLAMSGNEILMLPDAELGPIDPQMRTSNGTTSPAVAILEQFRKAQSEIAGDQTKLAGWMPILSQMGPSLIIDCDHAIRLSGELVETWAREYMFAGEVESAAKAKQIADYLGDHKSFKSHGRCIKIAELLAQGVKVKDLSTMGAVYEAVTVLYCCFDILFANTPVYKIFENVEAGVVRQQQQMTFQMPPANVPKNPQPPPPLPRQ